MTWGSKRLPCAELDVPRNWFKGSDTTVMCLYLEEKYSQILDQEKCGEHKRYCQFILKALQGSNKFFKVLYRAGFWLSDRQRQNLIDAATDLLAGFTEAAGYAWNELWLPRFKLQPKLHMFAHVRHQLITESQSKARSISPLAYSTQLDEDFVGRICTFSRATHSRTLHSKSLQKYKIALAALW